MNTQDVKVIIFKRKTILGDITFTSLPLEEAIFEEGKNYGAFK